MGDGEVPYHFGESQLRLGVQEIMSNDKAVTKIENMRLQKSEDLCKLVELIGYRQKGRFAINQLQCNNGAYVSSLTHFFDDNPGAMEAIAQFIIEHIDGYELDEELTMDEEDDDGESEDENAPDDEG